MVASIGNVLIVTGVLGVVGGLIIGTFERNEQTDAKTAEDTTANILKVVRLLLKLTTVRSIKSHADLGPPPD
jgi:muramoyltetrapeptide carboxypeptidase LdcA involved in peptidoglycan recycling